MSYNGIINHIENNEDQYTAWKFKYIVSREGQIIVSHYNCKGCWYNFMVEWEKC